MINKRTYDKIYEITDSFGAETGVFSTNSKLLAEQFRLPLPEELEAEVERETVKFSTMFKFIHETYLESTINEMVVDYMEAGQPEYWPGWAHHRRSEFSKGVSDFYIRDYTKKVFSKFLKNLNCLGSRTDPNKRLPKSDVSILYNGVYHISSKCFVNTNRFREGDTRTIISNILNIKSIDGEDFRTLTFGDSNTDGKTFRYFEMKYLNNVLKNSMKPIAKHGGLYLYGVPLLTLVLLVLYTKFPTMVHLHNDPDAIKRQIANLLPKISYGATVNNNPMVYIVTSDNALYNKVLSVPRYNINSRRNVADIHTINEFLSKENKSKAFSELTNKDFFDFEMMFKFNKPQFNLVKAVIPNLV